MTSTQVLRTAPRPQPLTLHVLVIVPGGCLEQAWSAAQRRTVGGAVDHAGRSLVGGEVCHEVGGRAGVRRAHVAQAEGGGPRWSLGWGWTSAWSVAWPPPPPRAAAAGAVALGLGRREALGVADRAAAMDAAGTEREAGAETRPAGPGPCAGRPGRRLCGVAVPVSHYLHRELAPRLLPQVRDEPVRGVPVHRGHHTSFT